MVRASARRNDEARGSAGPGDAAAARSRALRPTVEPPLWTALGIAACVYLAVLPVSGAFVRSVAFTVAAICAFSVLVPSRWSGGERICGPDRLVAVTLAFWSAWSCASLAWSINARYSLSELQSEIAWGLLTMFIFYVASARASVWRALVATTVGTAATLGLFGWLLYLTTDPHSAKRLFERFHIGVGAYSTFIVVSMPFVPLLLMRGKGGFTQWAGAKWTVGVLAFLALSSARLTENRMMWLALGAAIVVCAPLAARRWHAVFGKAPVRWLLLLAASLALLVWLFAGAVEERLSIDGDAATPALEALADDPRLSLWSYLLTRIGERPWIGYGFGKSILQVQIESALHDPLLSHAHNVFVSQWLQTGAIGLAAFVVLLAALVRLYGRWLGRPDDRCAVLGLAGIALVTAFLVKGLTDDFLHRSPAKEFWALNAMLLGYGTRVERTSRRQTGLSADAAREAAASPPRRRHLSESA